MKNKRILVAVVAGVIAVAVLSAAITALVINSNTDGQRDSLADSCEHPGDSLTAPMFKSLDEQDESEPPEASSVPVAITEPDETSLEPSAWEEPDESEPSPTRKLASS